MSESHILIDIPESSLTGGQHSLSREIKNQFDAIQHDIKPGESTYSNSTWFFFFLKYGKSLFSNAIQSTIQSTTVSNFFKDMLSLTTSVGGGHTVGYSFFRDCLLNTNSKDIAGIKFRRVTRSSNSAFSGPLQQIRYGAPGTGKSFGLDDEAGENEVYRTTFHPDSDYSTFVGTYKPTMVGEGEDAKIVYSFRPQSFMNAYVAAWKAWTQQGAGGTDEGEVKPVILIIEEINRGNCAQIFGDLFQLLDRDEEGYSSYPIDADADLAKWLATDGQFGTDGLGLARPLEDDFVIRPPDWEAVMKGTKLALPPNLYIWATMNTSDQSLFPIDSAFKRRWEWKYVPIAKPVDPEIKVRTISANKKKYDWWDFISIINAQIADVTKSEDKQLGYFFVKAPKATGEITSEQFASKVLFYLFNDVFKDWDLPMKIFGKTTGGKYAFKDFFYDAKTTVGEKTFLPGDVKEEEVAAFIERQELDGKTVAYEAVSATA